MAITPSVLVITPSGQKSAQSAQALHSAVSTGRSSDHVPVCLPRESVGAHREDARPRRFRELVRRLDPRVARERVLRRAARVALPRGEHVRARPRLPMRDATASSRNASPSGMSSRTHAPSTAMFPIGRPSDERMPLSRAMRDAGTCATSNGPACGNRVSRFSRISPPGLTVRTASGDGGDGETTARTSQSRTL